MKYSLRLIFFILFPFLMNAQQKLPGSLKIVFRNSPDGPLRFKAARDIYNYYEELNRDSALYYTEQQVLIAQNNHHKLAEAYGLIQKGYQLTGLGRFADALQCLLKAFAIAEDKQSEKTDWDLTSLGFTGNSRLVVLSYAHHIFAILMLRTENLEQQIIHFKEAGKIGREIGYPPRYMLANMNLGQSYLTANKPDTALIYEKLAEQTAFQSSYKKYIGTIDLIMGDIYQALGDQSMSLQYYYAGMQAATEQNNRSSLSRIYLRLTKYHLAHANKDSALYYSIKNLHTIESLGSVVGLESNMGIGYENMYLSYKLNDQPDSTFKYQGLTLIAKDSLNKISVKKLTEFQNLVFSEQLRLQNVEKEKEAYQNKIRTYFLLTGIGGLLLLAIIFYRNNRQKHKAKIKIEQAYDNLKATQQQLIQSEKMASLGELTAGIAHEIQNPLNFVNNFSEVNEELIRELKGEADKGNLEEVKAIANDIAFNSEKINHHGKRADTIVKGMLQHSRTSSGQKEPTDINALTDEYLRLAYHGLRAKDKSFNADIKTDFDNSIGKINIISQDIGRVILNLINNAFYAVDQKKKHTSAGSVQNAYEPTVSVTTKKENGKIEIKVKDNGNGIPPKVLDKIFQPFFTTKPTGQGTGLGLSLAYDIITKGHGGELKVETREGEGSEFIIQIPVSKTTES